MNGVSSKQQVTLPPASSSISDGGGAPGRKLQGACLPVCLPATCALVTLAGAKTTHVGGMSGRSLRTPAPAPAPGHLNADGGVVASAGEVEKETKPKGPTFTHDRSHLRQSAAPLVRCPSLRGKHSCTSHLPDPPPSAACLSCPCKHRSLPPLQPASALRFRLCRCLDGELRATTSSAAQASNSSKRQQSCPTSGGEGGV